MKENIYQHMKWLAQYCGGTLDLPVLSEEDVSDIMPELMKNYGPHILNSERYVKGIVCLV